MSIGLDLLFVPRCAGCKARMRRSESGICADCRVAYEYEKTEYCDFCGMEASLCRCIPQHLLMNGCTAYRKLAFYHTDREMSVVRNMIFSIKRENNRVLMRYLAGELAGLCRDTFSEDILVTYAPRSRKAVREYGYDHAKLLARDFSEAFGCRFQKFFRRRFAFSEKEQKSLNARQRTANVRGKFVLTAPEKAVGKDILLLDDVVTSGATVGECMSMLYRAGAKSVSCVSIAYTYRKNRNKAKKN